MFETLSKIKIRLKDRTFMVLLIQPTFKSERLAVLKLRENMMMTNIFDGKCNKFYGMLGTIEIC